MTTAYWNTRLSTELEQSMIDAGWRSTSQGEGQATLRVRAWEIRQVRTDERDWIPLVLSASSVDGAPAGRSRVLAGAPEYCPRSIPNRRVLRGSYCPHS